MKKPTAQKSKKPLEQSVKPTTRPQQKHAVDLAEVERLAALGFSSIAEVARHMRIPAQRMTGADYGPQVQEAFELGRLRAKEETLTQYQAAIDSKNGNLSALLIFKAKQIGWSDRPNFADEQAAVDNHERAIENIKDGMAKLRRKYLSEATHRVCAECGSLARTVPLAPGHPVTATQILVEGWGGDEVPHSDESAH